MGETAAERMRRLLDCAEREGSCCIVTKKADRRLFDRHVAAGDLVRPAPGVYAESSSWEGLNTLDRHLRLVRALAKQHPNWIFCDVSAAAVHGFGPSYEVLDRVHIASTASHSRYCCVAQLHHIRDPDVVEVDGIRVTSPRRTAADCLRRLDFVQGLAIADAAVRKLEWSAQDLMDYLGGLKAHHSSRGMTQALVTASYADGRAENGGESIARANMIRLGYELPKLQVTVGDPIDEGRIFRADFMWRLPGGSLVAGELDGMVKYKDPQMLAGRDVLGVVYDEKMRESHIGAQGITTMRFSFEDARQPRRLGRIMKAYGIPKVGGWTPQPKERPDVPERRRRMHAWVCRDPGGANIAEAWLD